MSNLKPFWALMAIDLCFSTVQVKQYVITVGQRIPKYFFRPFLVSKAMKNGRPFWALMVIDMCFSASKKQQVSSRSSQKKVRYIVDMNHLAVNRHQEKNKSTSVLDKPLELFVNISPNHQYFGPLHYGTSLGKSCFGQVFAKLRKKTRFKVA